MTHLSDLNLDALASGVLARGEADVVRAHLEGCAECAARAAELGADRAEFARTFDPSQLAADTLPAPRPWQAPWVWGAFAAAAAALLVGVFLARPHTQAPDHRTKGSAASLELFVAAADAEPQPVGAAPVPTGSRLRLRFDPGGRRFARVLWANATGHLDDLHPAASEGAIELLDPHGPRWMTHGIDLDDERQDEAVVGVFCDRPFGHAEAVAVARDGSDDCTVARLLVRKTP